jgi:hypothetical protein
MEVRHDNWEARILLSGIEQNSENIFVSMDEYCVEDGGHLRSVYFVATSYQYESSETQNHLEGIVLESCGKNDQPFKRIGCFNIGMEWLHDEDLEEQIKEAMRMLGEAETRIIELV